MQAVRGSMSIHGHLHEKAAAADALPACRRTAGIELISAVVDGCHKSCPARHVDRSLFSRTGSSLHLACTRGFPLVPCMAPVTLRVRLRYRPTTTSQPIIQKRNTPGNKTP